MKLPQLKTIRTLRKHTIRSLAVSASVAHRTIVLIEANRNNVKPETAQKLADALNVSVSQLTGAKALPVANIPTNAALPPDMYTFYQSIGGNDWLVNTLTALQGK